MTTKRRGARRLVITDDVMRTVRLIAFIALAVVAIPLVLLSAKFISVNVLADNEQTAYQRRAWAEAQQHAEGLQIWNFFEEWKAHYNLGVVLGMRDEFEPALEALGRALELVPENETNNQCIIITNIVYVIEKQGDAARDGGDQEAANGFYHDALDTIESAPEGCFDPPNPYEANTAEQLTEAQPRIEAKIVEDESGGDGEGEGDGDGDGEQDQPQTPEEQLQEQNEQAQQQQQQQEQYESGTGEEGQPGDPPVDRPW